MSNNFFFFRFGTKCIYIGPDHLIGVDVAFEAPKVEFKEENNDEI